MTGIIRVWLAALMALAAPGQGEAREERLVLPSGLEAYVLETRVDDSESGPIARFRLVAEAFTGTEEFDTQTADLEFLCNTHALPALDPNAEAPYRVVISLADRPTVFGEFDPEATQIFESFSVSDGACILELF